MERFTVSRVVDNDLVRVGTIERTAPGTEQFRYASSYLERNEGPLSLSLPLSSHTFSSADIRPYFDGLLPTHLRLT